MPLDPPSSAEADPLARCQTLMQRLNRAFAELNGDAGANLAKLTRVAGEILNADAVIYSISGESGMQPSAVWQRWEQDEVEDQWCSEVVLRSGEPGLVIIADPAFPRAAAQGVRRGGYGGHRVTSNGKTHGVLGAFFHDGREFDALDEQALSMISHMISMERDRDESRRAIQLEEEKFGAFFRSSLDGVLVHDLKGKIIDANPSAERMFGFPLEWLVRMNLTRLVPPASAGAARDALREVRATGYSRREIVLRRMDGTLFSAEIVGSRFEINGEARVHGIIRDITLRKRALDQAAERDLRFRKVFEQSLDGILLQDDEGTVVEANETMARMLGLPVQEMIGMNFGELHPAKDREERLRFFQQIQALGESRYECDFRCADDSLFSAEVAASSFDLGGHRFVQKIVRDVTVRREAEAEIRKAMEEAERANEAKSVFLATMSHEIRTPLNGIIGFARLLEEGNLDETQRQHLEMVKTSGNILLGIINDILDFSRIESGHIELEEVVFNPAQLLADTLALHTPGARLKNLDIQRTVADDVPSLVRGDPSRLRQVLMNLIGNAVKFTEQGSVRAGVEVCDAGKLRFFVRDSGPGFTAEQQMQLFQPFYQTDVSATRKHGGTGLGLAISRRLMNAMGGGIEALRHPDGAEFRFWMPLVEAIDRQPRRSLAPVQASELSHEGVRVLVAEDQPINARLITLLLERLGVTVEIVGDGPSVLQRLKITTHLPAAVLLDMRMPGMDGVEVARRIRAGEAGLDATDLPLVAVTANALASDRKACLDAGMDRYLTKPVTPEALERVLLDIGVLQVRSAAAS